MAAGDIGTGLRTYLASVSAITNALGNGTSSIFPDVLPQNPTLPAITYAVVSGGSEVHLNGSAKVGETRIQINCVAATRASANSVAELVRVNLEHYSGAAGDDDIDVAYPVSMRTTIEPPKDASDSHRYVHSRDWIIWHSQPAVST